MTPEAPLPAVHPPTTTDLAIERTLLAHERTLMAWVRTATSLISFGFTIYKFFDYQQQNRPELAGRLGPREFAMAMIGIGLTSLVLAVIEHYQSRAALKAQGAPVRRSLALITAFLIALLGIAGLSLAILGR
jgi:putative membrane protein